MRFLFVDNIDKVDGDRICGRVRFPVDEPLQYVRLAGQNKVAAGAVSEALGQLASWLCIERGGFVARPVFLFADKITVDRLIDPGTEVEMECVVSDMDDKTFNFSGVATVGGEKVATIENCNGYFMPLDQMEDPAVTRSRYEALTSGGLQLAGRGGKPFPFSELVTETIEVEPDSHISVRCELNPDYPFYADHFPRFPVTPIVVLNETFSASASRPSA